MHGETPRIQHSTCFNLPNAKNKMQIVHVVVNYTPGHFSGFESSSVLAVI